MAIARRYELFNGALQIPQFTSEDEVLSAGASTIVRYISIPYAETWLWLWLCDRGAGAGVECDCEPPLLPRPGLCAQDDRPYAPSPQLPGDEADIRLCL